MEKAQKEHLEKVLKEIQKRGLRQVTEEEYNKRTEADIAEKARKKRLYKKKRALLLAAMIGIFAVGMTIVAAGRREYKYALYPVQGKENILFQQNVTFQRRLDDLDRAYAEIEEKLGIKAMCVVMPEGMEYQELVMDDNRATLVFEYQGKKIMLREEKYNTEKGIVGVSVSDRLSSEVVYNPWLETELVLEENFLESGEIEYSINLPLEKGVYYLSGIMPKKEFKNMAESLRYQN
ncbi:MAG: DUF4367 domain-containing protein [Eubacteriales bacterium]|nr:DUF4367 domain-containing protein [Eubacteriales bacterium]